MNNKWYLLPGMGANSSMYDSLRREVQFEIHFIDWPEYKGERSYAEVAKRVIEENGINENDVVGGSSLGGMVALEIARQENLTAVVLIGSAITPAEVSKLLSLLAPFAAITPISLMQILVGKLDNILSKMFAEANSSFIRAMCQYLPKWSGVRDFHAPVFRIHGQNDHVVPCPKTGCDIIANAGHLLAITHPKECGALLTKIHQQLTGSARRRGKPIF